MLASSEFGEPNAYEPGFDLDDVAAGRYGSRLHFWNLAERRVEQTLELGETGLVPLEVRWLHDPDADQGFVGAALSSTMWHFHRDNGSYAADQVIAVEGVEQEGWPFPVPGLITDLVVSMDDRFLYFSNWLHGDLRQYDISDPANPRLTGRLQLGGVLGRPVRRRPRAQRRPADAPALARRPPALRHQLALLDLGQPVLPRPALVAAARELRPRRRDGDRPATSSSTSRRPAARARPRGPPPGRRLHDRDLPVTLAHVGGIPIEETLGLVGPAVVLAFGVAWANLRARTVRRKVSSRLERREAGS